MKLSVHKNEATIRDTFVIQSWMSNVDKSRDAADYLCHKCLVFILLNVIFACTKSEIVQVRDIYGLRPAITSLATQHEYKSTPWFGLREYFGLLLIPPDNNANDGKSRWSMSRGACEDSDGQNGGWRILQGTRKRGGVAVVSCGGLRQRRLAITINLHASGHSACLYRPFILTIPGAYFRPYISQPQ